MNHISKELGSPKEPPPETIPELLRNSTMGATEALRFTLKQEREDMADDDLGESSRRRADMYMTELDILDSQLQQLAGKSSTLHPVVRQNRRQMGKQGYENLFTVRWAPRGEELPFGPENPQNQLAIHAIVNAPEDVIDAIYGESIKGNAPPVTLHRLLTRAQRQIITVNTMATYRDHTGIHLDPQAGISFVWLAGEKTAKVAGVTYIRKQPFFADLDLTIPYDDFSEIQRAVMKVTASAARTNTKLPGR